MKADDQCVNCHHDFADHNYVIDSIDVYTCPVPKQESGYGGFKGGDPRKFFPDGEFCSSDEIKAYWKACALWDEMEDLGETPTPEKCPSGWIGLANGTVAHVLKLPYGLGVYTMECETAFEPVEHNYEDLEAVE